MGAQPPILSMGAWHVLLGKGLVFLYEEGATQFWTRGVCGAHLKLLPIYAFQAHRKLGSKVNAQLLQA